MSQEYQPVANEDGAQPAADQKTKGCEDADKCCICLPIGCGLKTMSVVGIISTVVYMGLAGLLTAVDTAAGAIMFVAIGPMIVGGYLYIRFLIDSEN